MRLARIDFVRSICVPGGRNNGAGAPVTDVRDQTFTADEGWAIEELGSESVTLARGGAYVRVEGVGYSCVPMVEAAPVVTESAPVDNKCPGCGEYISPGAASCNRSNKCRKAGAKR